MARTNDELIQLLDYINPATLSYQEWVDVGMALKHEGVDWAVWDAWSRADSRYHIGECRKKWESFNGSTSPVTGGTIVQMAKDAGWRPMSDVPDMELDWDSVIGGRESGVVIRDPGWLEGKELQEPDKWDPVRELITYLETLFDSTDNVGYVTTSFERDGKYMPCKGNWDRTAGELIEALQKCGGDIGAVLGDYNEDVGAWIRFNPLDGNGCKNDNVTDYRFALVESDHMELEKQNALIRELELPVAALVYSGGKSVHAIVRIEAATLEEYRKRVDYLYTILKKNGMDVDTQNKNPSRLSRMPGVWRGEHKQFLIDTNIGKATWAEWKEWIEASTDDLPDFQNIAEVWGHRPAMAPELIPGILRKGRKMMIVGASKTGKSMLLSELAIAIAEGGVWLGRRCCKGKVLYVNLEIPEDTFWNRILDIYETQGIQAGNNLTVWNLRGFATQMDKLTPKLVRRALKLNPEVVIIDPIYKVLTGDENSAEQMARFCNEFDKLCTQLKASTIYCHHHSKGAQGGKAAMDRASGSGVFARDADTLLDLTQLNLTDAVIKQEKNKAVCTALINLLQENVLDWQELVSQDAALNRYDLEEICERRIADKSRLYAAIAAAEYDVDSMIAIRAEGTLREFPRFKPIDLWFRYPLHYMDAVGTLSDLAPNELVKSGKPGKKKTAPEPPREKAPPKEKQSSYDKTEAALDAAFSQCDNGTGMVRISDLCPILKKNLNTVKGYIDASGILERDSKAYPGYCQRVSKSPEIDS